MKNYSWWAENIAENIVKRWHSQGGIDQEYIRGPMREDVNHLLSVMGDEIENIHDKGFKEISKFVYAGRPKS